MKVELSLPERPSALFLVAVVDLLVVLLIFFTLIPVVAQQAGVVMDFAELPSRAPTVHSARKTTVTITGGAHPAIYVGGQKVELEELRAELIRQREASGLEWVYVLPDKRANWDLVLGKVMVAIQAAELKVIGGGTLPLEGSASKASP